MFVENVIYPLWFFINVVENVFLWGWRNGAQIVSFVWLSEDVEVNDGRQAGFYVSMSKEISSYVYSCDDVVVYGGVM